MLLQSWAGLSEERSLPLTASQGLHRSRSLRCCHSVLTIPRMGIQEGSSPLAAADGCSREEACSACTAAMRISVGSVALLTPSTDARRASSAAAPTPLRALALICGTKGGSSSHGSLICAAAKAILLLPHAAGMQHQPTLHALLTIPL